MAEQKRVKYKAVYRQLADHDFLATASLFGLIIVSAVLVISGTAARHRDVKISLVLGVSSYQKQRAALAEPQPENIPKVLDASTLDASDSQPAPETWQGPIEPLPDDPALPAIPVLNQIPTAEPVVFLGIDDGWVQTPYEYTWLTQHHLPFTLFLTDNGVNRNYPFFQQLQTAGMTIEDHTISHPDLTRLTLDQQKAEICGDADKDANVFGIRPTLFRPPYGKANQLTLQAATDCGMRAVIMWHALIQNGAFQYQDGHTHLEPGDIVLMHFTNNFPTDIQAFMNQIAADHLQVARLEDWLP